MVDLGVGQGIIGVLKCRSVTYVHDILLLNDAVYEICGRRAPGMAGRAISGRGVFLLLAQRRVSFQRGRSRFASRLKHDGRESVPSKRRT
jgi:hypothetical protein